MTSERLSFVFFGSGPVATNNLRLLREHFSVEAIITKATTEQEMRSACPDTPLFSVSNKNELDKLLSEHTFRSSVGVLIDFGIIVSTQVIDSFKKGIVNSHFSLLPQWRGADPITFSILSGQERTGVSLMLLTEKMDEGPIVSFGVYEFKGDETTPELTDSLIHLSTALLCDSLEKYVSGLLIPASQNDVAQSLGLDPVPTYSRKLSKQDGNLDWKKPAMQLAREVRAFSGWPKSFTNLGPIDVTITKAYAIADKRPKDFPGKIIINSEKKQLLIACESGYLAIEKLKPAGKNEMDAAAFLAGYSKRITV